MIAEYREGLYIGLIKNFPVGFAKRRRQNSFKTTVNNIHVHIGANLSRASEQLQKGNWKLLGAEECSNANAMANATAGIY